MRETKRRAYIKPNNDDDDEMKEANSKEWD